MTNVKTMEATKIMEVKEDAAHKTTGISGEAVVVEPTVILHITVGHT